jgi:hypothetical protein
MTDYTFAEAAALRREAMGRFVEACDAAIRQIVEQMQPIVVSLAEAFRTAYRDAGEPFGPATDLENVVLYFAALQERLGRQEAEYQERVHRWVIDDTVATVRGVPRPPIPEEPKVE